MRQNNLLQPAYHIKSCLTVLIVLVTTTIAQAQDSGSTAQNLHHLPIKYLTTINDKVDKYSNRITGRTVKALEKLSRWEAKIQKLLSKVNPEAAQQLFGNGQTTFATLLQKLKEGKTIAEGYQAHYHEYRDQLTNSIGYLQQQKNQLNQQLLQPLQTATEKLNSLEQNIRNSEAVEVFIKERKKQLIDISLQYIGKSKCLQKINKESYYYIETLKNYKELFSDPKKAEELGLKILNKIPAFSKFLKENSMLAGLFDTSPGSLQSIEGLQTQAIVQDIMQQRLSGMGPNAQEALQNNIQQAQQQLQELKSRFPALNNPGEMPEFKPNEMRTKPFFSRLEFGGNLQFNKSQNILPNSSDIALQVAYKLNDKSSIGVGAAYKLGLGTGLNNIRLTHEGIGLRTFMDWKLKGSFYINGGYEQNHLPAFNTINDLKKNTWKASGLIGISKKYTISSKLKGNLMLLYDFLYNRQMPKTQPLVFRLGYGL